MNTLTLRDQQVIWHPYTQHKNKLPPVPVVNGKGTLLFDENGNSYIDAISSWWVNIHGHGHPYIAERIYQQALRLEHVIFTGFTHEPAVSLAERLLPILPGDLSKVFYSDNGSTAVEVALKMAVQFFGNQAAPRKKIMALHNSYHGDTFGAMSVSQRSYFTAAFGDYLFEPFFIDAPNQDNLESLKDLIRNNGSDIACFIYEPLLQAAGGMIVYSAPLLDALLDEVKKAGILCIADEVLTGFGRTGPNFASEKLRNKPDIICLSKGLTGGTMALGVTATTEEVFSAFLSDDRRKTLFHGHSFTANPIACASALASLDLFLDPACIASRNQISSLHHSFAKRLAAHPIAQNIRIIGTVIAFELAAGEDGYINSIGLDLTQKAMAEGIYLRPLGNTAYIMPPYCITDEEIEKVYDFIEGYLARPGKSHGRCS